MKAINTFAQKKMHRCTHPYKEGMALRFSILAWEILWTEEPGRL